MSNPANEPPPSEGAPEWMVSYADMITILMAFFVVMFAMSGKTDPKKEQPVYQSLRRQFGEYRGLPATPYNPRNTQILPTGNGPSKSQGAADESRARGFVGDHTRVRMVRQGDQSTLGGVIFFPGTSVTLDADQQRLLDEAAQELGGKLQRIEIRGHTFNRPLDKGSKWRDPWDLAYERCHAVMVYLEKKGIDPQRMRIGVAAQNEPLVAEGKAQTLDKNGRVEVFMLNEFATDGRNAVPEKSSDH